MDTIEIIKQASPEMIMEIIEVLREDINVGLKSLDGRHFNYVLLNDSEIIYVGYTQGIYRRMVNHNTYKKYSKVFLIEFKTEAEARRNEYSLIRSLNPNGNKDKIVDGERLKIDDGYGRRRNAGRKPIGEGQKKVAVTIYLTREEIEQLGGMNELKKHLTTMAQMKLYKRINQ